MSRGKKAVLATIADPAAAVNKRVEEAVAEKRKRSQRPFPAAPV